MILFRLLSFVFKVTLSFLFVLILQVQIKGKSLETHLIKFSYNFFLTRSLKKVSQDGAKLVKDFPLFNKNLKSREIAFSDSMGYIKDVVKQPFHKKKLHRERKGKDSADESGQQDL